MLVLHQSLVLYDAVIGYYDRVTCLHDIFLLLLLPINMRPYKEKET